MLSLYFSQQHGQFDKLHNIANNSKLHSHWCHYQKINNEMIPDVYAIVNLVILDHICISFTIYSFPVA